MTPGPSDPDLDGVLAFVRDAGALKDVLRQAWTATGRQESTAEHSWRLCLLAMMTAPRLPDIDPLRLLELCILHDLGEAIHGDVPANAPDDGIDKAARERADLQTLMAPLPEDQQQRLLALWDEYENATSPEARIAKGLDKLETILQHNQGANPGHFDFAFNLDYGRRYTSGDALLAALRERVDADTRAHLAADLRRPAAND